MMKIPGAKTLVKYKGNKFYGYYNRHGGNKEYVVNWSYMYLKSRKKIKKKNGVNFIYEYEGFEWDSYKGKYIYNEKGFVSIHALRSMSANKLPGSVMFIKGDEWNALFARLMLIN